MHSDLQNDAMTVCSIQSQAGSKVHRIDALFCSMLIVLSAPDRKLKTVEGLEHSDCESGHVVSSQPIANSNTT